MCAGSPIIPSTAASLVFESIDRLRTVQPQTSQWRDSSSICCLVDFETHLGHVVRAGDCWLAFDATHLNEGGTGFRPLGSLMTVAGAKCVVETGDCRRMRLHCQTELAELIRIRRG